MIKQFKRSTAIAILALVGCAHQPTGTPSGHVEVTFRDVDPVCVQDRMLQAFYAENGRITQHTTRVIEAERPASTAMQAIYGINTAERINVLLLPANGGLRAVIRSDVVVRQRGNERTYPLRMTQAEQAQMEQAVPRIEQHCRRS